MNAEYLQLPAVAAWSRFRIHVDLTALTSRTVAQQR